MKKTISFLTQSALMSICTITIISSADHPPFDPQKTIAEQLTFIRNGLPAGLPRLYQQGTFVYPNNPGPMNSNFDSQLVTTPQANAPTLNLPILPALNYLQYFQQTPLNLSTTTSFIQPQNFTQQSVLNFGAPSASNLPPVYTQNKSVIESQQQEKKQHELKAPQKVLTRSHTKATSSPSHPIESLFAVKPQITPQFIGLYGDALKQSQQNATQYLEQGLQHLNNPNKAERNHTLARFSLELLLVETGATQDQITCANINLACMDFYGLGLIAPNPTGALERLKILIANPKTPFTHKQSAIFHLAEYTLLSSTKSKADYTAAYRIFHKIAFQTNTLQDTKEKALCWLIKINYQGCGADGRNFKEARRCAGIILNLNNPKSSSHSIAEYFLAIMDFKGLGSEHPDYDSALKGFRNVLTKANIEQSYLAYCCMQLGDIYLRGLGSQPIDYIKSGSYFALLFNNPISPMDHKILAFLKIIQIKIKGTGEASINYAQIREDLHKIINTNHTTFKAEALLLLADMEHKGLGLPSPDYKKSIEIYKEMSLSKNLDPRFVAKAKFKLIEIYYSGVELSTNYHEAYKECEFLLASPHATPQQKGLIWFYLAKMDAQGDDTHVLNTERAINGFRECVNTPSTNPKHKLMARFELARMALLGRGNQDTPLEEIYRDLSEVCSSRDIDHSTIVKAQLCMAEMDITGQGLSKPDFEKIRSNLTAIISDDKETPSNIMKAKFHLTEMDYNGLGIETPDHSKSMYGYMDIVVHANKHQKEVILASLRLGQIHTNRADYETSSLIYKKLIDDNMISKDYRFEALFRLTEMKLNSSRPPSSEYTIIRQYLNTLQESSNKNHKIQALIWLAKMDYKGQGLLTPNYESAYQNFKEATLIANADSELIALANYWFAKMIFYGKGLSEPKPLEALNVLKKINSDDIFKEKHKAKISLYSTILDRAKISHSLPTFNLTEMDYISSPNYGKVIEGLKSVIANENLPQKDKLMARVELTEMALLDQGNHFETPESIYHELSGISQFPNISKMTLAKAQLTLAQMELLGNWVKHTNFEMTRSRLKSVIYNTQASPQDISKARYLLAEMDFDGKGIKKPNYLSSKMEFGNLMVDPHLSPDSRKNSESYFFNTFFEAEHLNMENEFMDVRGESFFGEPTLYDIRRALDEESSSSYYPPQNKRQVEEINESYFEQQWNFFGDTFIADDLYENPLTEDYPVIEERTVELELDNGLDAKNGHTDDVDMNNFPDLFEFFRNIDATAHKRPAESEINNDRDTKRKRTEDSDINLN